MASLPEGERRWQRRAFPVRAKRPPEAAGSYGVRPAAARAT
jgi:hypothetical protein